LSASWPGSPALTVTEDEGGSVVAELDEVAVDDPDANAGRGTTLLLGRLVEEVTAPASVADEDVEGVSGAFGSSEVREVGSGALGSSEVCGAVLADDTEATGEFGPFAADAWVPPRDADDCITGDCPAALADEDCGELNAGWADIDGAVAAGMGVESDWTVDCATCGVAVAAEVATCGAGIAAAEVEEDACCIVPACAAWLWVLALAVDGCWACVEEEGVPFWEDAEAAAGCAGWKVPCAAGEALLEVVEDRLTTIEVVEVVSTTDVVNSADELPLDDVAGTVLFLRTFVHRLPRKVVTEAM
jgi:hypothetical protein